MCKPRLAAAAKGGGARRQCLSGRPLARTHTRDATFEGAASQRSAGLRSHTVQGTLTLEARGNPAASMLPLCRCCCCCCSCPTCSLLANWTRDTFLRRRRQGPSGSFAVPAPPSAAFGRRALTQGGFASPLSCGGER